MDSPELQAILQGLPNPTLVLSQSTTILAANDGVRRLISRTFSGSPIGKEFRQLGFRTVATSEDGEPEDWESFFRSLTAVSSPPLPSFSNLNSSTHGEQFELSTEEFWNFEDLRPSPAIVTTVFIQNGFNSRNYVPGQPNPNLLRASMKVHLSLLENDDLVYIVSLSRPDPRQTSTTTATKNTFQVHSRRDSDISSKDISLNEEGDTESQVHRKVSSAIPYFTALFDARGQAVHLSKSWYRVTGMNDVQSLDDGWFEAIHKDDRPSVIRCWEELVSNQQNALTLEVRFRRKSGEFHWFLVRVESPNDPSGRINHWYASMIDVHDLLVSRQESENRRRSIMTLMSHTNVCLWGMNKNKTLLLQEGALRWSPIMSQRSVRNIPGDRTRLNTSVSASRLAVAITEILDGNVFERTLEHEEGGKWYRSTLISDIEGHPPGPPANQTAQAVLALTIDVTDVRARAELEVQNGMLVERERAAQEASELKSRFVANMSHELRTPVAGIIGMNDLLWDYLSTEQQREFSKSIQSSAAQLLAVINDVLDLSKIEAGRLEIEAVPFHLCELVQNVHNIMAIQAEQKGLNFVCEKDYLPQPFAVIGDPNRLQQIFLNLVSNSIKFTQSGRVTMSVTLPSKSEVSQTLTPLPPSHKEGSSQDAASDTPKGEVVEIEFIVEDTGCGMTVSTIDKSFEAFSQADSSTARKFGGTGLGLTITRQLVHMMKGSINFTSTISVGTRAVVKMAFHRPNSDVKIIDLGVPNVTARNVSKKGPTLASESEPNSRKLGGKHSRTADGQDKSSTATTAASQKMTGVVLVAEDNPINARIAQLMVEAHGCRVLLASNGKEALNILEARDKANQSLPNLVLMDCMMPIIDGYDATRQIRQNTERFSSGLRRIPIIALTASAQKGDRDRCIEAGMDDYLTKPVNKKKLGYILGKWLSAQLQGSNTLQNEN